MVRTSLMGPKGWFTLYHSCFDIHHQRCVLLTDDIDEGTRIHRESLQLTNFPYSSPSINVSLYNVYLFDDDDLLSRIALSIFPFVITAAALVFDLNTRQEQGFFGNL